MSARRRDLGAASPGAPAFAGRVGHEVGSLSLGAFFLIVLAACSSGPLLPAPLDTRNESCGSCRMTVSDVHFAAQIVAPGELPVFFDDIGCLRVYLLRSRDLPRGAVVFVADHRTGAWTRAAAAVYSEVPGLATPMASHWIAHADEASRAADPNTAGSRIMTAAAVFGPARVPDGSP
jgi:copper chaperone NosL